MNLWEKNIFVSGSLTRRVWTMESNWRDLHGKVIKDFSMQIKFPLMDKYRNQFTGKVIRGIDAEKHQRWSNFTMYIPL